MIEVDKAKVTASNGKIFDESKDFGKVYVKNVTIKRNGRTRLIKQIINDSSLQLIFLLPDEDEHLVEISLRDKSGEIDLLPLYSRNQFRYLIFPKSQDDTLIVVIHVDGDFAYGGTFRIPAHLRTKKKTEIENNDIVNEIPIESAVPANGSQEQDNHIGFRNIDIDLSIISAKAIKILKETK